MVPVYQERDFLCSVFFLMVGHYGISDSLGERWGVGEGERWVWGRGRDEGDQSGLLTARGTGHIPSKHHILCWEENEGRRLGLTELIWDFNTVPLTGNDFILQTTMFCSGAYLTFPTVVCKLQRNLLVMESLLPNPLQLYCHVFGCFQTHPYQNTVKLLLSGHPRDWGSWLLNRGWPLNRGSLKFSM